jgi:pimeloyl-ACP methyl ester carboxylesterase
MDIPGLLHDYPTINGIRMHVTSAGKGEPILMLHGFPESWYSWRHQIAALKDDYHVFAPDLRGYNQTENSGPYDTDTLRADVAALIDHIGGPVHLVAHDWGAAIAWLVAIHEPHLLKTLTICNVPHPAVFQGGLRNPRQLLRSWYIFFFQIPWLPEKFVAARNYHTLARGIIRDCRPGTFTREDVQEMLAGWRRQGLSGGINWYRAAFRQSVPLPDPVPIIQVPTLMIWGENDRALGKELTYGTDEYVADLDLRYVQDTSHWVQQEEPELVTSLIRQHVGRKA